MLIVIVIIGILIAALMPRMQSAQWRARDVARKNDLSQIATAIVTSQQDRWQWPGLDLSGTDAGDWISVSLIENELLAAWMSSVPKDPLASQVVKVASGETLAWQYYYKVMTKNSSPNWWFVLVAKTEIEWWSNYCMAGNSSEDLPGDLRDLHTCNKMTESSGGCNVTDPNNCTYSSSEQLRFVYLY